MAEMKSNKQMLQESALGLTKTFAVLFIIIVFKLSFLWAAGVILTVTAIASVIQAGRGGWPTGWFFASARGLATTLLVLAIIAGIYHYLGNYTVLALLLVVGFIAGFILYNKREEYITIVRHAETRIWGSTAEERKAAKKKEKRRLPYG